MVILSLWCKYNHEKQPNSALDHWSYLYSLFFTNDILQDSQTVGAAAVLTNLKSLEVHEWSCAFRWVLFSIYTLPKRSRCPRGRRFIWERLFVGEWSRGRSGGFTRRWYSCDAMCWMLMLNSRKTGSVKKTKQKKTRLEDSRFGFIPDVHHRRHMKTLNKELQARRLVLQI